MHCSRNSTRKGAKLRDSARGARDRAIWRDAGFCQSNRAVRGGASSLSSAGPASCRRNGRQENEILGVDQRGRVAQHRMDGDMGVEVREDMKEAMRWEEQGVARVECDATRTKARHAMWGKGLRRNRVELEHETKGPGSSWRWSRSTPTRRKTNEFGLHEVTSRYEDVDAVSQLGLPLQVATSETG